MNVFQMEDLDHVSKIAPTPLDLSFAAVKVATPHQEYDDPKSIFFSFINTASMRNARKFIPFLGQMDKDSFPLDRIEWQFHYIYHYNAFP